MVIVTENEGRHVIHRSSGICKFEKSKLAMPQSRTHATNFMHASVQRQRKSELDHHKSISTWQDDIHGCLDTSLYQILSFAVYTVNLSYQPPSPLLAI